MTELLLSLLVLMGIAVPSLAAPASGVISSSSFPGAKTSNLCSPVVWRPDRHYSNPRTCTLKTPLAEIASGAEVVSIGSFWDVTDRRTAVPPPLRCAGAYDYQSNAAWIQRIRAASASRSKYPIRFIHPSRFDLVPLTFAAMPGFDASFLLRTKRPFAQVTRFFDQDKSPVCRPAGCRWSDSYRGDPARDHGQPRLRDLIDASGVPGTYRSVVYYLSWGSKGTRVFWPQAAIADLRNPRYRAWRVAEAKRALAAGGYDAVMLNQKFSQYLAPRGPQWIGGARAPNVTKLDETNDTLWSAPPEGYGYPEYVAGWAALGKDLRAAKVPYAVMLSSAIWTSRGYDDRSTPNVDEAALIRSTASHASVILVEPSSGIDTPRLRSLVDQLSGSGALVVAMTRSGKGCDPARRPSAPGQPQLKHPAGPGFQE